MKQGGTMKRFFVLTLLPILALAAGPAPYPVSVNSQSPVVTSLQSYQANERTFRVTFKDGTNAVDLTGYTPRMTWATTNTATNVATSAWSYVVSSTSGVVDFTFTPASMNTNGVFIYEVGIDGLPFVYRQGVFAIISSPQGNGAAALTFTNPASYVATVGSQVTGLGFNQSTGAAVLTGSVASASGAITGNQYNAILGGLTVSNAIQFGAAPSVTTNARSMYWDVDEHTISVPMEGNNAIGQMFMEGYLYGQNKSGRTVSNGTAVKITADPGGTGIRFDLASSTNMVNRGHFIGLVTQTTITNNGFGYVTTWGQVHDLNTAAFTNGDDLFLDGDGIITNVAPSPPAYPVHIGYVVRSHASQGIVYVRGGNVELDPVWSTVSNSIAVSIAGKLATNGVQAGGGGGVTITNANGIAYVSATGGGGSGADTNSVGLIATNAVNESTNVAARLASNVWAAADSTTNYVSKTGDSMTGTLRVPRLELSSSTRYLENATVGIAASAALRAPNIYAGWSNSAAGIIAVQTTNDTGYGTLALLVGTNYFAWYSYPTQFVGARLYMGNPVNVGWDAWAMSIVDTNMQMNGSVQASSFAGDGSGLTGLNGSAITNLSTGGTLTTNSFANSATVSWYSTGGVMSAAVALSAANENVVCDWYGFRRNTTNENLGVILGSVLDTLTATNREAYYAVGSNSSNTTQNGHALASVVVPTGHGDGQTTNLAIWAKDSQLASNVVVTLLLDTYGSITVTQSVGTTRTKVSVPWSGVLTNVLAGTRIDIDATISLKSTNGANVRVLGFDRVARFER